MSSRVLLVMPNKEDREVLAKLFTQRGLQVDYADSLKKIEKFAKKKNYSEPLVTVIDIHLPESTWLEAIQITKRYFPDTSTLFATDRSDPSIVSRAKTLGAKNFLRAPYDEIGLTQALKRMEGLGKKNRSSIQDRLPVIRTPIRVKIILPYIVMAIIIGLGAALVVNDSARNNSEERLVNQLLDAGNLSADWMVREEDRLLSSLRLMSNTQGMAEAISLANADRLRELALPIAINNGEQAVEILDANGFGLISLHLDADSGEMQYARGDEQFAELEFVQSVIKGESDLNGDKFAGLATVAGLPYFYVSGPVRDDDGNLVGIILVGKPTDSMAFEMKAGTLAHITLYDVQGNVLSSTLSDVDEGILLITNDEITDILAQKEDASLLKRFSYAGEDFRELLYAWEARAGQDLGVIGTSVSETVFIIDRQTTNIQIFMLLTGAFFVVILLGLLVARRISNPLMEVVQASTEVAKGNFDVRLRIKGNDEIAVLAHSFNRMVVGLKDGQLYRNLLGRTVSPEVRDQLRSNLATGDLQLQGQFAIATILMADIHDFTTLSEREDPTTVMVWLNELFSELVPIITYYDGVVNEISGDALFSFFGILPQPQEAAESAYLACQAGLEMLLAMERINLRRSERGDSPLTIGIGINTGPVTAGGLGSQDRLHYTVIGDTVNTTQRIETLAHQFEQSAVMISKQTLISMWDRRTEFNIESYGNVTVKGKQDELEVYRLLPEGVSVPAVLDLEMVGG